MFDQLSGQKENDRPTIQSMGINNNQQPINPDPSIVFRDLKNSQNTRERDARLQRLSIMRHKTKFEPRSQSISRSQDHHINVNNPSINTTQGIKEIYTVVKCDYLWQLK